MDYRQAELEAYHFRGLQSACGPIAFSVALDCSFNDALTICEAYGGFRSGYGTHTDSVIRALIKHGVIEAVDGWLECARLGESNLESVDLYHYPNGDKRHVKSVAVQLRKRGRMGTYLVYSAKHVSTIREGQLQDWTARKGAKQKRVERIIRVTKGERSAASLAAELREAGLAD